MMFTKDSKYDELVAKAKELGINYVGIKKAQVIEMVNEKLAAEAEQPVVEVVEARVNEVVETPVAKEKEEAKKAGKWFEAEGAFPYNDGDIVEVIAGKILIGRKAKVVKPSAKKNAVKAHLIHPVNGELQKTLVTLDFDKIQLANEEAAPAPTEEEVAAV